jgi:crossover junction endodeoxyribonuclease RuvC
MIILGIDPGTATTGYGVIRFENGTLTCLEHGCIRTDSSLSHPERLLKIYQSLLRLIEEFSPTVLAVEKIFFNVNVKTAMSVGEARGTALLAGAAADIPVAEYNPLQVKMALVGYGKADKKQVQYMVQKLLGLGGPPRPSDAADALAVAICHAHSVGYQEKVR